MYPCHAGLIEAVAPILDGGRLLGFLMMGQTTGEIPSRTMWKAVAAKCRTFHADMSVLEAAFYNLAALPIGKIEAAARLLVRQASLILQSGASVTSHVRFLRLAKAKQLLEHTVLPIGEIASQTGWQDLHYFSRLFRKSFGMTPSQYRQSVYHLGGRVAEKRNLHG